MKIIKKIENGAIKIDFEDLPKLEMIDDFGNPICYYGGGSGWTSYGSIIVALLDEHATKIKQGPIEINTDQFSDNFHLKDIKDIIMDRIRKYKTQYNYFLKLIYQYETLEFEVE